MKSKLLRSLVLLCGTGLSLGCGGQRPTVRTAPIAPAQLANPTVRIRAFPTFRNWTLASSNNGDNVLVGRLRVTVKDNSVEWSNDVSSADLLYGVSANNEWIFANGEGDLFRAHSFVGSLETFEKPEGKLLENHTDNRLYFLNDQDLLAYLGDGSSENIHFPMPVTDALFLSARSGFAVTQTGILLSTPDAGKTWLAPSLNARIADVLSLNAARPTLSLTNPLEGSRNNEDSLSLSTDPDSPLSMMTLTEPASAVPIDTGLRIRADLTRRDPAHAEFFWRRGGYVFPDGTVLESSSGELTRFSLHDQTPELIPQGIANTEVIAWGNAAAVLTPDTLYRATPTLEKIGGIRRNSLALSDDGVHLAYEGQCIGETEPIEPDHSVFCFRLATGAWQTRQIDIPGLGIGATMHNGVIPLWPSRTQVGIHSLETLYFLDVDSGEIKNVSMMGKLDSLFPRNDAAATIRATNYIIWGSDGSLSVVFENVAAKRQVLMSGMPDDLKFTTAPSDTRWNQSIALDQKHLVVVTENHKRFHLALSEDQGDSWTTGPSIAWARTWRSYCVADGCRFGDLFLELTRNPAPETRPGHTLLPPSQWDDPPSNRASVLGTSSTPTSVHPTRARSIASLVPSTYPLNCSTQGAARNTRPSLAWSFQDLHGHATIRKEAPNNLNIGLDWSQGTLPSRHSVNTSFESPNPSSRPTEVRLTLSPLAGNSEIMAMELCSPFFSRNCEHVLATADDDILQAIPDPNEMSPQIGSRLPLHTRPNNRADEDYYGDDSSYNDPSEEPTYVSPMIVDSASDHSIGWISFPTNDAAVVSWFDNKGALVGMRAWKAPERSIAPYWQLALYHSGSSWRLGMRDNNAMWLLPLKRENAADITLESKPWIEVNTLGPCRETVPPDSDSMVAGLTITTLRANGKPAVMDVTAVVRFPASGACIESLRGAPQFSNRPIPWNPVDDSDFELIGEPLPLFGVDLQSDHQGHWTGTLYDPRVERTVSCEPAPRR